MPAQHCSICGKEGHNKRTCLSVQEKLVQSLRDQLELEELNLKHIKDKLGISESSTSKTTEDAISKDAISKTTENAISKTTEKTVITTPDATTETTVTTEYK